MQTFRLIALFAFVGIFFSSCEKFELEDHCPEEEQTGPTWNAGDVRGIDSNSDITRFDDDLNQDNVFGEGSNDSGDSEDKPDDDLVNDDSDNEDENQSGRKVVPTSNSGNSAPSLQK